MITTKEISSITLTISTSFTDGNPSYGFAIVDAHFPGLVPPFHLVGLAGSPMLNGDQTYAAQDLTTPPFSADQIAVADQMWLTATIVGTLGAGTGPWPSVLDVSGIFLTVSFTDGSDPAIAYPTHVEWVDGTYWGGGLLGTHGGGIVPTHVAGKANELTIQRQWFGGLIDPIAIGTLSGFGVPKQIPGGPDWLLIEEGGEILDRTNYLHLGNGAQHSFTQQLRQRGQATVQLEIAADDAYMPTRGWPLYLFDHTKRNDAGLAPPNGHWVLVFAGFIQDIEVQWIGKQGDRYILLTAVSMESIFDTVYARPVEYVDQTCGFIFSDLYNRFAMNSLIQLGSVSDGTTLPLFNAALGDKLSDIFTQLATTSGFTWRVDLQTGTLFFGLPDASAAPFDISDAEVVFESVKWKVTGADYRNREAVKLSYDAFGKSGEYFAGTGQQQIQLARPAEQVTSAFVTLSTCNTATGTFSDVPADGDTVNISPTPGAWQANHIYALGGTITVSGFVQQVTFIGSPPTSGASMPTFSTVTGQHTTDGNNIWTCLGPLGLATGSDTYTFVTTLDNTQFGQVLISPDVTATCQNLVDAINANALVRGFTFSLPTWECNQCNAINNTGLSFTLQQKAAGTGYVASLFSTSSAFTWSNATTTGGTSPQGSVGKGEGATISLQVYVEGTSTAAPAVVYTPGSDQIFMATPLNSGTNLNVFYTRTDGDVIEVENTADVAAFQAITQATGEVQQMTDATSQGLISTSGTAGLLLAQKALSAYGTAPTDVEVNMFRPGLQPGMGVTITGEYPLGAASLLSGTWVVEEISGELLPNKLLTEDYVGHYKYTIKLIDASQIGSFLDFWEGLGGGGTSATALATGVGSGLSASTSGLATDATGATISGVQQESYTYAPDTGTANAYAVTLSPAPVIVAGSVVVFKAANPNTGASTLTVNGGTAKPIYKNGDATALVAGDIIAGQVVTAVYDGSAWQTTLVPFRVAPPVFVQGDITNSSATLAYPSNNTAGNCLVVAVRSANGAGTPTINDTAGNTYTSICDTTVSTSEHMECWVAFGCLGGANTVTVSGSGVALLVTVLEYSGVVSASGTDVFDASIDADPSVTTTVSDDLVIFVGTGAASSPTAPTQTGSYTSRFGSAGTYGGTPRGLSVWDTTGHLAGAYTNGLSSSPTPYSSQLNLLLALKAAVPLPGTVTSVALTMPSDFTVTGSPLTTSGTLAVTGGVTRSGVQQEAYTYAADTGAANAYAVTLSPAPTIVAGSVVVFKAAHANTGASTLNVNGGGAVAIRKDGTTALASNDIVAGQVVECVYDGTNFQALGVGVSGMVYGGAWSNLVAYDAGDVVLYGGALYLRLIAGGGGVGAPSVVQSFAALGSSHAFGSNVTSGNVLVVAIGGENSGATFGTPTDTLGTTYTLVNGITGNTNNLKLYKGVAPSSGANTVTYTNSGSFDLTITGAELANVSATVNASATAYNSTTPSTVALTTTVGSCYIFAAIRGFHNANVFTAVSGFTLTSQAGGSDATAGEAGPANTATTYTVGFTSTGGADNAPLVAAAFTTSVPTPDVDTTNWIATGAGAAVGTVTSVALTMPSDFTVTGSPVTSSGTLAVTGGVTRSGVQQEAYTYAADSGSANAYAVTLSPAPTIVAGSVVVFKAANANTTASTLNVNGGGAVAIRKNGNSTALASGDITAGQIITVRYDGTVWQTGGGGGGAGTTWIKEVPTGTLDSSNVTFTLSPAPATGSLTLFLNVVQSKGTDFALSGSTVVFTVAPKARDAGWFFAEYQY